MSMGWPLGYDASSTCPLDNHYPTGESVIRRRHGLILEGGSCEGSYSGPLTFAVHNRHQKLRYSWAVVLGRDEEVDNRREDNSRLRRVLEGPETEVFRLGGPLPLSSTGVVS